MRYLTWFPTRSQYSLVVNRAYFTCIDIMIGCIARLAEESPDIAASRPIAVELSVDEFEERGTWKEMRNSHPYASRVPLPPSSLYLSSFLWDT